MNVFEWFGEIFKVIWGFLKAVLQFLKDIFLFIGRTLKFAASNYFLIAILLILGFSLYLLSKEADAVNAGSTAGT